MKKTTFIALALGLLTITSCSEKKAATPAPQTVEEEVIKDSATQQKVAGDYTNPDGSTVITLGSDFSVKVKNHDKEYYKWEFLAKPDGNTTLNINLVRKGLDADIKDPAILDMSEEKIVVKNETFRKKAK